MATYAKFKEFVCSSFENALSVNDTDKMTFSAGSI